MENYKTRFHKAVCTSPPALFSAFDWFFRQGSVHSDVEKARPMPTELTPASVKRELLDLRSQLDKLHQYLD
jgi:hypothetical protein